MSPLRRSEASKCRWRTRFYLSSTSRDGRIDSVSDGIFLHADSIDFDPPSVLDPYASPFSTRLLSTWSARTHNAYRRFSTELACYASCSVQTAALFERALVSFSSKIPAKSRLIRLFRFFATWNKRVDYFIRPLSSLSSSLSPKFACDISFFKIMAII